MKDLSSLEESLGVKFNEKDLLLQGLTHRSYINENPQFRLSHNERLEFLGDAVLELVVTKYLYGNYTNPEGELTSWRAALVNSKMLAQIAKNIGINDFLFLSRGEAKDMGRAREYILANAMEAIIGAIYLDQGFEGADEFVCREIVPYLPEIIEKKLYKDPKSRFQEEAQERVNVTPTYEVLDEWGPDHEKHFVIGVFLDKDMVAKGEGSSKQEAQESAASNGLEAKGW
ncbi:MAG: ribonuclease III [Candidatus Spechtbacteria bacterium RIFCSPHIGHO2_02_FULL_43_15b]|uniref:Ribonuclease 3 n=1 Tax=Candidatus Spechtbacteria bacterium RIFCSPHIGHO2_01_FULL_43_30 TaxID=1802158 RepID=A0A1G2H817_9BACT|nr:MAG: ribonuclease III [Candidatus Spechtbacteria bacterium RIFCSPHIGHO2_01_FULL_43_30]OGZ59100.1 MAG: ribonuclease III [Candidatus Spechtbacteria bacterium RIFCSPHIGHO2_02_FULL_43_15b]